MSDNLETVMLRNSLRDMKQIIGFNATLVLILADSLERDPSPERVTSVVKVMREHAATLDKIANA